MKAAERAALFPDVPSGGMFQPGSVMWKISRERIILIGGGAAAVLQAAHPKIARGVAEHSDFLNDAYGRLTRTLEAVYVLAFGAKEEVEKFAREIARRHQKVKGPASEETGKEAYSAFDEDLQLWTLATLVMAAVPAYENFVGPLSWEEKESYLRDMRRWCSLFGLDPEFGPQNWTDFSAYYNGMIQGQLLGSEPLCAQVAEGVMKPRKPLWLSLLMRCLGFLIAELVPSPVRERLGMVSTPLSRWAWRVTKRVGPRIYSWLPEAVRFPVEYRRAVGRLAFPPGRS